MKLKNILLSTVLAAGCMLSLTACGKKSPAGNIAEEITLKEGDKYAEITIEDYGTITAKLFPDIAPLAVENFEKLSETGYYDGLKIHRVAADMCIQGGSLNGDGSGGNAVLDDTGVFPIETSKDARNFYGALGCVPNGNGENGVQFYIVSSKKKYDITKYSADLIKEDAAKYTAQKEELEENDPELDHLTYMETRYNNLADMISKPGDDVIKKYKETSGGYPMWDGAFTVFGQVYDGWDVLTKITEVEVVTSGTGKLDKPKTDIIIESVKVYTYEEPEEEEEEEEESK